MTVPYLGCFKAVVVALGFVLLSLFGSCGSVSAEDIQPASDSAPDYAIAIVDTAGSEFLLYRPLIQYQWLARTRSGGLPEVRRIRSALVVLEEEISGELHAFQWGDLQSIASTDPTDDAPRILVKLVDGHTYRCMPGYVHPEKIPELLGLGPSERPSHITRTIQAVRLLNGHTRPTDVSWSVLASIEVYSVPGDQGFTRTRAEALIQERGRLRRLLRTVEDELSQHINALIAP